MQVQTTTHSPGGHERDHLLREAERLRSRHADPLKMALVDPKDKARYEDAGLFRDVVAYLEPILKIVFQSREIELARRSLSTSSGEIALRFVLRGDGTLVKYDQANNSDTASPLEFMREPGHLDTTLATLSTALLAEQTPIALAAADEIRMVRHALGTVIVSDA